MQQYTWFFTLPAPLTADQSEALSRDFAAFTAQWKSHGTPVEGLIEIRHHRFIIAQADPTQARPSGCSIDSLKRGVAQILQQHGLSWLDAGYVCYRDAEGHIQTLHFSALEAAVQSGELGPDTLIFDHTLDQTDDLSKWEVPLKQTWLKRYLAPTNA
ncbi:MAG: hypothetical protein D6722_02145 [Bacteroidetes bacterium]|nr:MAG: hypothetical protein D6722_02145 [Bacteroidota bacterium]